jgi:hypothetical protein
MKKVSYHPLTSVHIKDKSKAGDYTTAREIADLLNFGVVKGYVKNPGQKLKTHYFNCGLNMGKVTEYYLIAAPNASAEYYVDETKFAHYKDVEWQNQILEETA